MGIALRTIIALVLVAALAGGVAAEDNEAKPSEKVLVFLVPGTFGSSGEWPLIVKDKASFASEMVRALPSGSKSFAHLWAGYNRHDERMASVNHLVKLIDSSRTNGYRIALVGHSHGGSVCLAAAARAKRKIESVVCLGAPHFYLDTVRQGKTYHLPVYCSPKTLSNTEHIVSLSTRHDRVARHYAQWSKGIEDKDAAPMTQQWQERLEFPRLRSDGPIHRFFGLNNLVGFDQLVVHGVHNVLIHSAIHDSLGIQPHNAVHSRRMGYLVGRLLRERCSSEAREYLSHFVQPPDGDGGEPVPLWQHYQWLHDNQRMLRFAGWVLERAEIKFHSNARAIADDLDNSLPDGAIRVRDSGGKEIGKSAVVIDSSRAPLKTSIFFHRDETQRIIVEDRNLIFHQSLGEVKVTPGEVPSAARGNSFDVKFQWKWAHY